MPHHERREAIASVSTCAARQPRHACRRAAGLSRRRVCRPGVVRPDAQGPGRSRAPVLGTGEPVPRHDAAALRRQSRVPGTSGCRGGRPQPAPAFGPVSGDLRQRSRPRSHEPRAAGVVRGLLCTGKDIAAERDSSRLRHRPQRRRTAAARPGRRAVSRRCGQDRRGQGTSDGLVALRWGDDRGRPRRRAGRGIDRRRAWVRNRGGQRTTLGGHLGCRRRGGAGPRRDSRAGRQSGEPDGVSCLSLAADGAYRGGIPARTVGARPRLARSSRSSLPCSAEKSRATKWTPTTGPTRSVRR